MSLRFAATSMLSVGLSVLLLSACSSSKIKERKEQRDRVAQSSKMYCEFINGDIFPDIDVAVNLEMAKRCDADKPYSISQYNTRSDSTGIMYCCSIVPGKMSAAGTPAKKDAKKSDGKDDEIIE
jgi:hypothetical protein